MDLDDLFAYRTPRTVLIRDRWLGISWLLFLIGLFFYVVIYEIVMQKGYLLKEPPVSYTRVSVRLRPPSPERYETLKYCQGEFGCVVWDEGNAVVPPAEERSAFVTTRVNLTRYDPLPHGCIYNETVPGGPECPGWKEIPAERRTSYVASPEDATLLVTHAVYGLQTGVATSDMKYAKLIGKDGKTARVFCDKCDAGRIGDIMSVRELMMAADMGVGGLDDTSPATGDALRYDGIVLLLVVEFSGNENSVGYKYHVRYVPKAEYKYVQVLDRGVNGTHTQRETYNRHGVRVVVVPTGWIGVFSFTTLLITLVTGVALFAIAQTLTDWVAMGLLPHSSVYRRYVTVRTIDFSDLPRGGRLLKNGKETCWGSRYLTDEAFAFGELDSKEQEVTKDVRRAVAAENHPTTPEGNLWEETAEKKADTKRGPEEQA